jgi:hypothetical protein
VKKTELKRKVALTANPDATRAFVQRGQRNSKPKRRAISPASPEQRESIHGRACLVTGDTEGLTPAHLVDRSLGGCDSPLCVVPLRLDVHRAYDEHQLDLLPYLEAHGLREEIAHAVTHLGLIGALQRLTGEHWQPVEEAA